MRALFYSLTFGLLAAFLTSLGCQQAAETSSQPDDVPPVDATPVTFANARCPIMGGEPTPELTAQYKGKTIGFCCDGCPQKWAALSEEDKAEKFAEATAEKDHQHADDGHAGHEDHDPADHADLSNVESSD